MRKTEEVIGKSQDGSIPVVHSFTTSVLLSGQIRFHLPIYRLLDICAVPTLG